MAAVAFNSYNTVPRSSKAGMESTPIVNSESKPTTSRLDLINPSEPRSFSNSLYTLSGNRNEQQNAFGNWKNYSINTSVQSIYQPISSPSFSNQSSLSPQSSHTSSPSEPTNQSQSQGHMPPPSTFSPRPRSRSLAIPPPTTNCPNCGLRRPSADSSNILSLSPSIQTIPFHRPHLPLHLHCPDACPDTVFPKKSASTSTSTLPHLKQRHHRRRSSLCYAESLVEDAEVMDNGRVPAEVKQSWEQQAEIIARGVMNRKIRVAEALKATGIAVEEEAVVED